MSTKPNPVALTAAMLTLRAASRWGVPVERDPYGDPRPTGEGFSLYADLASRLHRLARGAAKASLAECNGELYPGQRDCTHRWSVSGSGDLYQVDQVVDEAVKKYCARIDRAIDKLNLDLAPLAIEARRNGDPRGCAIKLRSTDTERPLPSNEMGGEWGIG